ncbi:cyd operon YbgE family protein [Salinivibrio sp. ES.052]|uniref:cyd operon YbgE family protein n=1 Tax=Salinivibrio sp. ES.052 TaxID=1882823 RepID=UPI000929D486|nr:cyd operon YbgE family protein [Salinivibrio sp. ES.052]SIN78888.1 cyd operon protein YbgE [Salinivibrio sp. ES.052]
MSDRHSAPLGQSFSGLWRLLSLASALCWGGQVMWAPEAFAQRMGGVTFLMGIGLLYATCVGVIHAIGFRAQGRWSRWATWPLFGWLISLVLLTLMGLH